MSQVAAMVNPEIIGISGSAGSGKDTAALHIDEIWGYSYTSASDCVRDELALRRMEITRSNQRILANHLRATVDPAIWVKRALEKANHDLCVVSGIYSVSEARYILNHSGIMIHMVGTGESITRVLERSDGARDQLSEEDLSKLMELESSGASETDASVSNLQHLATHQINNYGSIEDLYKAVDSIMELYKHE